MTDIGPGNASGAPPLLSVRQLRKSYRSGSGVLEVLRGVDFDLNHSGFVAVVGQSGSGKSTLLHLMGLLDEPDAGEVHIAGIRVDNLPAVRRDKLRNTDIGMVFQSYHLLPEFNALENVLAPLMVRYSVYEWMRMKKVAHSQARALLERFGLGQRLHHKPRQLSGGEMQRVAIARALISQPRVLLADEPTGNLDEASGTGILDTLCELNRQDGLSIVLVTHDASIARRADRIVRLVAGHVEIL
ncbi:MAG: ATP-binding protein [Planctomycetaceae bacterium]|nr:MAG: ATP-binding protein [Planctomycetaceae bacterium]